MKETLDELSALFMEHGVAPAPATRPAKVSSIDKHGRLADVGPTLDLSNQKLGNVRT
jgi:hypothetical protein